MKPTILLTGRPGLQFDQNACTNFTSYSDFFLTAGGLPVTVAPCSKEEAEAYAQCFDALCITGGEDVDPRLYSKENTDSTIIDPAYENMDLALYHAFRNAHKPILGICRGLQIVNVAEGGTLFQDLLKTGSYQEHNQRNLGLSTSDVAHSIQIIPDSILSSVADNMMVNSFHHQAVKDVAETLRVSALSPDGVIEALEADGLLLVQWHPERLIHEENHLSIGRWLVQQAISGKCFRDR